MEKLTVKNLGPIKDFTMETNRLTVLIGPQASGKSLLAQMLYFFGSYIPLFADKFSSAWREKRDYSDVLRDILDDLRGTNFDSFCATRTSIDYTDSKGDGMSFFATGVEKQMSDLSGTKRLNYCLSKSFTDKIIDIVELWNENRSSMMHCMVDRCVYIPTERSVFSRLVHGSESVLYSARMPLLLRKFANIIEVTKFLPGRYPDFLKIQFNIPENGDKLHENIISKFQIRSLGGKIKWIENEDRWAWLSFDDVNVDILPLEAISSGQMETWPFFWLANSLGSASGSVDFYFEEPETHLHPNAQVEVVKTIAYLISRGHRFVITTHSPFILYVINNLIQSHIAYEGNTPEGEFSINPDHVAAYCLGEKPRSIVDDETRLLNLDEIDDVFDDIGEYFQTMLEKSYEKRKKS